MYKYLGQTADYFALLGGAILGVIVLVTTANAAAFILDRFAGIFGADISGLPGYEDTVRLMISVAALMFFPYCQLHRGHVAVDILVSNFSQRIRRTIDRVWLVVIAATAFFLAYWLVIGLLEKKSDNALAGVIGWPEWPFYVPGIAALILWGCISLAQTVGETNDV